MWNLCELREICVNHSRYSRNTQITHKVDKYLRELCDIFTQITQITHILREFCVFAWILLQFCVKCVKFAWLRENCVKIVWIFTQFSPNSHKQCKLLTSYSQFSHNWVELCELWVFLIKLREFTQNCVNDSVFHSSARLAICLKHICVNCVIYVHGVKLFWNCSCVISTRNFHTNS